MSGKSQLFTVGYEGRQLDELIAVLQSAEVDTVIDIRELPLSRRRGFSKTPLGHALREAGIEYVHLRVAGNPYRREDDALAKYAAHVNASSAVVTEVAETARGRRAADSGCQARHPLGRRLRTAVTLGIRAARSSGFGPPLSVVGDRCQPVIARSSSWSSTTSSPVTALA